MSLLYNKGCEICYVQILTQILLSERDIQITGIPVAALLHSELN